MQEGKNDVGPHKSVSMVSDALFAVSSEAVSGLALTH